MALRFKKAGPEGTCCDCDQTSSACDECDGPYVCSASLECEGVSSSGAKEPPPGCATVEFDYEDPEADPDAPPVPPKYYLTYTRSDNRAITCSYNSSSTGGFSSSYSANATETVAKLAIWTCDEETGETTVDASGSYYFHQSRTTSFDDDSCTTNGTDYTVDPGNKEDPGYFATITGDEYCLILPGYTYRECYKGSDWDFGPFENTSKTTRELHSSVPASGSEDTTSPGPPPTTFHVDWNTTRTRDVVITLSDEWIPEETGALIERVTDAMPGWDEAGPGCGASRNLSEDETSYSISKFRWRIVHPAASTGSLTVHLKQTFTPEDGGPPVITYPTYTWSGSPDAGMITGGWHVVNVPDTDGATTIEIVSYEC